MKLLYPLAALAAFTVAAYAGCGLMASPAASATFTSKGADRLIHAGESLVRTRPIQQTPMRRGNKIEKNADLPEIVVVRPPHDPYLVAVIPGELQEANVREWIAYCHPHLSLADGGGIRHYVYQQGTTGCEFGMSAP